MNAFEQLNTDMLRMIGWTIIHSAWQFLALYAALRLLLFIINKRNSNLRYLIAISIMAAAVMISALTFHYEYKQYFGNSISSFTSSIKSERVQQLPSYKFKGNLNVVTKHTLLSYLDAVSPYLTFGWIAGMLFYTFKIITGSIYLFRLRNIKSEFYPGINERLLQLRNKMRSNKLIKLIITNSVTEPFTFGNLKPIILLPCSYVANVPMDQIEMILAHELAHIKRHDYTVNMVQTILEAIFFFNPFFKYLSDAVRNEREYCCDDMASKYCGNEKTMAVALANLKIIKSYPGLYLAASPAQSILQTRINRLIAPGYSPGIPIKTFLLSLITMVLALLFLIRIVNKHKDDRLLATVTKTAKPVLQTLTKTALSLNPSSGLQEKQTELAVHSVGMPKTAQSPAIADTDTTHSQKPMPQKTLSTVNINSRNLSVRPVSYKTDTVEYRATNYIKRGTLAENATLDKLIAQMEGFKIDSMGRIFHQGQRIDRISIDGNVLLGQGLPKNITAGMIKYVQVCYSDEPVVGTLNFIRLPHN